MGGLILRKINQTEKHHRKWRTKYSQVREFVLLGWPEEGQKTWTCKSLRKYVFYFLASSLLYHQYIINKSFFF
jgi:hypothetical protein